MLIIQTHWTLVRDKEGKPSARLIINRDITQQRLLEAQFRRAQRLESLGNTRRRHRARSEQRAGADYHVAGTP